MENHKLKEQEAISEVEKDVSSRLGEGKASVEDANTEVKKKKKRNRGKDGIDAITNQELPRCDVKGFVNEEEEDRKPKKKKRPVEENIENEEPPHELKVKKKKSKKSKDDSDELPLEVQLIALTEEE